MKSYRTLEFKCTTKYTAGLIFLVLIISFTTIYGTAFSSVIEEGLMGVQGHFVKKSLPNIDSEDTVWGDWVKRYPNSIILR